MKKLHLAFLWHMHQPWYREEEKNEFLMPWVFLHAIKDYGELLWIQSHYPSIKATYNLVPSLMVQLEAYIEKWQKDRLLAIFAKEPATLQSEEKTILLDKGFFANHTNMIAPLWRYNELFIKKSRFSDSESASRSFDDNELNDLVVLFLISWCGNHIRRTNSFIKSLIKKGSNFTQEEKLTLFEELISYCKSIVPLYKEMQQKNKIEIFTTAFYHPILPLLLDLNSAKESDNRLATPPAESWSDFSADATKHVDWAIEWYEDTFDTKPKGFWPAEGAVSNKALALLAKHGVKYACSDEDIIFRTLGLPYHRPNLYNRFALHTDEGKINLLFRDKSLSDLIGFNYSSMDAQHAADDFVNRLRSIYDQSSSSQVVSVFLDGENAWEFYPNNAFEFFNALYERLEKLDWLETNTVYEIFELQSLHTREMHNIATGSWIYGSLSTWMGHSEKNRAWELLAAAHKKANSMMSKLDEKKQAEIQKELMIAEGSDWFWWFGDDHYTPIANEFDELFRSHLIRVYQLLGVDVPSELNDPIKHIAVATDHTLPTAPIQPSIDGYKSSYFEWLGAGKIDLSRVFSAMDSSAAIFKTLLYGTDGKKLYFQLNGELERVCQEDEYDLMVILSAKEEKRYKLPLKRGELDPKSSEIFASLEETLEIASEIPLDKRGSIEAEFLLYKEKTLIQKIPLHNKLTIKAPDFDALWYI